MSKEDQISELLQTTSRLTALMEREAGMLRAMKPGDIQSLHEDKLALSAAYGSQVKALKENPDVLRTLPAGLRADFKAKIGEFQAALTANHLGLLTTRAATESALRAIADEVQAKTEKHAGYSANGATSSPYETGRTSALAFAYDQRL